MRTRTTFLAALLPLLVACDAPPDAGEQSTQTATALDPRQGLRGEYFASESLDGKPLYRRDASVDFDWASGGPAAGIGPDHFSARWTGKVIPRFSETYTLYVTADDGVRLYVDGNELVNDWAEHKEQTSTSTLRLQAGNEHALKLEYFDATGRAAVKLEWSSPSQAREVIPASRLRQPNGLVGMGILRADGRDFVDGNGVVVPLRGVNLGSWLLLEGWMTEFGKGATDTTVREQLARQFTAGQAQQLLDTYEQNFITEADFALMHSLGINLVRLPFYYKFFEQTAAGEAQPGAAFALLDKTLEAAARHGVYVVIDFHGVPGGQSGNGTTGEAHPGGAEFWTSAADQKSFRDLWKKIAAHYRDSEVVAGYDLINEPADNSKAVTTDTLVDVYDDTIGAIRSAESSPTPHLVIVERIQNPCNFAGPPSDSRLAKMRSWKQWVQSDHLYTQWCNKAYPDAPTSDTPASAISPTFLDAQVKRLTDLQDRWGGVRVPVFIGEFGSGRDQAIDTDGGFVIDDAFGVLPRQARRFNDAGYAWTVWSYKTWAPTNFGVVYPTGGKGGDHPLCGLVGVDCPVFRDDTTFAEARQFLGLLNTSAAVDGTNVFGVNPGFKKMFAEYGAFGAAP